MEKVVIISGYNSIFCDGADEVNEYLDTGWTVKSVNLATSTERTTAIFVLEKK